jgi:hypothetical protein
MLTSNRKHQLGGDPVVRKGRVYRESDDQKKVVQWIRQRKEWWMMRCVPLLLLTSCLAAPVFVSPGHPVYRPTRVSPEYYDVFRVIQEQATNVVGYDVIGIYAFGSGYVEVDDAKIDRRNLPLQDNKPRVFAFTQNRDITMRSADLIPVSLRASVLAHEIGHAMGLPHSNHGLMQPIMRDGFVGHEGEALVEALRDGGLLHQ